jgi:hypothetical protein
MGSVKWLQKEVLRWYNILNDSYLSIRILITSLIFRNKFASCEELYSACRPLCTHEIALLEARCTDFGMFLPTTFPLENLNPKFHVLVCEMHRHAKLMASAGISPGMGNEQSIEAIHVKFNMLQQRMRSAKTTGLKLQQMMNAQHIAGSAAIKSEAHDPVSRKRKVSSLST